MIVNHRQKLEEMVARLHKAGCDVGLRSGYGLWGLSSRDESRDISILYSARELCIFMAGFEAARAEEWRNKDKEIA